jgi:Na+/melibiose symporter-like transporter
MIAGMFIWGFCEGGFWVMLDPLFSINIDESIVMRGRRIESTYQGFKTFVSRAALVIQAVTFSVVHTLTNFQAGTGTPGEALPDQPPEAIFGIQIHFALIPAILMAIATILLWRFFDITPDKVKANKEKIEELGL